jgi:hypothetical protein
MGKTKRNNEYGESGCTCAFCKKDKKKTQRKKTLKRKEFHFELNQ